MPTSGALLEVNRSFLNQEDWDTSGIDVELNYSREVGPGLLSVNVLYNHLIEFEITDLTTGTTNREDGEVEYPDHRIYGGVNYSMNKWNFNWTVTWLAETVDSNTPELTNENSDTFGFPLDKKGNTCNARSYHDVQATYQATDSIQVFGGIRNLLDRDPCSLTQITKYGDVGVNSNGAMFDLTGRDFYLGVRTQL